MYKFLYLFGIVFFMGCQQQYDVPITQKINTNWQFKATDSLSWLPAKIPGNVFSDLLTNKIIKDPFTVTNEDSVQWVTQKDWMYRTTFQLTKEVLEKKHIELNLEGLDTYASIFVNDSLLGTTNNAFRKWVFDIKKIAKSENSLTILFKNFDEIETQKEAKNRYKLPEGKRIYSRKAQFQYGWDWGPKLNAVGIWKEVFVKGWNDYKIENIDISHSFLLNTQSIIYIKLEELNTIENIKYDLYINDSLDISNFTNTIFPTILTTNIKNPKLWWTHNLGDPYLYDIKVIVKKDDVILDSISTKYGIRDIKLVTKKDSIGEGFYFELNGKPVYAKGANYIPQHSFQDKVTPEKYQKLLNDVVDANMNMLRVWGGGIYENDIFYDLCDEKGILVWQDFMFACAMYPGDKVFLQNVENEAEYQVKRLRNHPSIAVWCGNNENSEGWKRWGWQMGRTKKEKENIWKDYLAVFDSILPNTVSKFSKTDYWESSPKYGRGNPKHKTEGDAHDWFIWHDAYPFEHLEQNVPRFMSEFGFQSFPSYEVIQYINQKDSIDLQTEAIKNHQKHARGFQLIEEYMQRDYKTPLNDEDYIYVSQLLQAKGIVMGIEAQRRAKPYNMGTLYWQLNDCWPAVSWSSIDYFGNWKALHYKVKEVFENVLVSAQKRDENIEIYIVNDNFSTINDTLRLKIIDFFGNEVWSKTMNVSINENSSKQVFKFPTDKIDGKHQVLVSEFKDEERLFYFEKPKNLILQKGEIHQKIEKVVDGFQITFQSDVLQKDVFLSTKTKGHFTNNFFDLLPHVAYSIHFKTTSEKIENLMIKTQQTVND